METFHEIKITDEIMTLAEKWIPQTKVLRNQASDYDTLIGNIGEIIFAEYFYNDYRKHNLGRNKGETDFPFIEVKTSAHPFNAQLNLMVRREYTIRNPPFYVQLIINVNQKHAKPQIQNSVYIFGWATHDELISKGKIRVQYSKDGSYETYTLGYPLLHEMFSFRDQYNAVLQNYK